MQYTIADTFDVSAKRYWDVFFSEEYGKGLWPALRIDWVLDRFDRKGEGPDLVIEREARLTPRREVPALLKRFVKGAITYTETNVFRAATNTMETITIPSFAADRVDNHGSYILEELGPNKVKRIWKGHCSCKIPLLGGKIEKFLVAEIEDSYRAATDFTRKWFAEHPQ